MSNPTQDASDHVAIKRIETKVDLILEKMDKLIAIAEGGKQC